MPRPPRRQIQAFLNEEPVESKPIRLQLQREPKIRRIDNFLSQRYAVFSRTFFKKLIKADRVTVNGQTVAPSYRLQDGDVIELEVPALPKRVTEPWALPLDVLYEDDDLFVINKPPGIICHPGRKPRNDTLANAFVYHVHGDTKEKHNAGIVHRLDVDTTGVMVVAKHAFSHGHLARQFEQRRVRKEYLALLRGRLKRKQGRIDLPIGYQPDRWGLMRTGQDAVKPKAALSIYEVLERFRGYTLVRVELKTGRTHQIRVHFEAIGHPVVADSYYRGTFERGDPLEEVMPRCALHAWKLGITHPTTGEPMDFVADLPADFSTTLEHLRAERKG
jgi:23S rRNA pseudouridine1911/1915/1917 synthase